MICALWISNLMNPIRVNIAKRPKEITLWRKTLLCLPFVYTDVSKCINFHLPDFSILIQEFSC